MVREEEEEEEEEEQEEEDRKCMLHLYWLIEEDALQPIGSSRQSSLLSQKQL